MNSATAPQSGRALVDAIEAVVGPAVIGLGADLEGVQVRKAGSRLLVRILVDVDGGVTMDQVADVSVAVSNALDADGVLGERSYVLDVGSPGVDRPLTRLRHWQRNAGRLVRVTETDGSVRTGRIVSASGPAPQEPPQSVVVDIDGIQAEVAGPQIKLAVVQVEFTGGDD